MILDVNPRKSYYHCPTMDQQTLQLKIKQNKTNNNKKPEQFSTWEKTKTDEFRGKIET